jgi:hypothetical protein
VSRHVFTTQMIAGRVNHAQSPDRRRPIHYED